MASREDQAKKRKEERKAEDATMVEAHLERVYRRPGRYAQADLTGAKELNDFRSSVADRVRKAVSATIEVYGRPDDDADVPTKRDFVRRVAIELLGNGYYPWINRIQASMKAEVKG